MNPDQILESIACDQLLIRDANLRIKSNKVKLNELLSEGVIERRFTSGPFCAALTERRTWVYSEELQQCMELEQMEGRAKCCVSSSWRITTNKKPTSVTVINPEQEAA